MSNWAEVQRWWPILSAEWRWLSVSRKGKEGKAMVSQVLKIERKMLLVSPAPT